MHESGLTIFTLGMRIEFNCTIFMLLTLWKWTPLKRSWGMVWEWWESFNFVPCYLLPPPVFLPERSCCCCTTTHLWGDQDGFESQNYSLCFGSSRRRVFGNDGGQRTRVGALEARAPETVWLDWKNNVIENCLFWYGKP